MLNKLVRLAEIHNIAVVVTNQVQSQPDNFFVGAGGSLKSQEEYSRARFYV
jgi:RecA/RadA recombinase